MKAAVTDGKGRVWIEDVPIPQPDEYQCLCRILACATCTGTDTKHIFDKLPWEQQYPGLLGHESIGRVVECGPGVRNFKEGDLVLRPAVAYPGETFAGFSSMWGGFAEYGLVTDAAAFRNDHPDATLNNYVRFQLPVPEIPGVTPADWTMIITLKECAGYVHSIGCGFRSSLLILGAGPVAMAMCRHAKIFGAWPVIVAARRDEPLARIRDVIGADFVINCTRDDVAQRVREITSGGVDFIIDTTGAPEFVAQSIPALNEHGRAAGYATYPRGQALNQLVPNDRIISGQTGEDIAHQYLIDCVRLGLVHLRDFYSHVLPLDDIARGFEMIWSKEAFKIVFDTEDAE